MLKWPHWGCSELHWVEKKNHPILYRTWRKNPVGEESFWWVSSDGARSDRNQEVSAAQHRDGKGSTSTWRSYLFFFRLFSAQETGEGGGGSLSAALVCKEPSRVNCYSQLYFKDESLSGFLTSHWYGMMIGWCKFYNRKAWWNPVRVFLSWENQAWFTTCQYAEKVDFIWAGTFTFWNHKCHKVGVFIFFPVRRSSRGKLGLITHLTYIKLSVHMMFFGPHYA